MRAEALPSAKIVSGMSCDSQVVPVRARRHWLLLVLGSELFLLKDRRRTNVHKCQNMRVVCMLVSFVSYITRSAPITSSQSMEAHSLGPSMTRLLERTPVPSASAGSASVLCASRNPKYIKNQEQDIQFCVFLEFSSRYLSSHRASVEQSTCEAKKTNLVDQLSIVVPYVSHPNTARFGTMYW